MLDITPLEKALDSLERGLARATRAPDDEELRDACIQRFEFTFELSWKMVKRRLEQDMPTADSIDTLSYRGLMRTAGEYGLVDDVAAWLVYRQKHNLTSHTYNADKATDVFASLPAFANDAGKLLAALKRKESGNG